jgi:hypothetical protein
MCKHESGGDPKAKREGACRHLGRQGGLSGEAGAR